MSLKSLEISGFKSFAKKGELSFNTPISAIVGPNGSGKSNIAEAFSFVLGEQSMKSLRGKRTEDLIWNGSETLPRQSRASVRLIFNNEPDGGKRLLNMDFDEVSIERVIHRDSLSEYLVNGTQVRLKDIIELLSGAHIGASGHHIISQGEADRILNANPKERREMIMDALGLKIYQYKREESEHKLEKTRENMSQVESLRREIAPHIKFLKKQVAIVEKTIEMRDKLRELYKTYLSNETAHLSREEKSIESEMKKPSERLKVLETELEKAKKTIEAAGKKDAYSRELVMVEKKLRAAREKKDETARTISRLEGEIAALSRTAEKARPDVMSGRALPFAEVQKFFDEFDEEMEIASQSDSLSDIRSFFAKARQWIKEFLSSAKDASGSPAVNTEKEVAELKEKSRALEKDLRAAETAEKGAEKEYQAIKEKIEKEKDSSRNAEREMFKIIAEQNEIRGTLSMLSVRTEKIRGERQIFNQEIEEGALIIGREVYAYEKENSVAEISREEQEKQRKEIEKIKIRLEDSGAVSADEVVKEYKETSTRDEFLAKELVDLETSAKSLEDLIDELEEKLERLFTEGIEKINKQFKEFFILMFGGGSSGLRVVEEKKRRRSIIENDDDDESAFAKATADDFENEIEIGIEIDVSLPRKKIKSLEMLSGGERALTSIALIFALSQVNPPPFLVLDETDAALDEANSRRYGDMLETLSKHSQLIVITHNRETMSRAGVLYGVTMGKDGASKLLSIAFNEAVAVAK